MKYDVEFWILSGMGSVLPRPILRSADIIIEKPSYLRVPRINFWQSESSYNSLYGTLSLFAYPSKINAELTLIFRLL